MTDPNSNAIPDLPEDAEISSSGALPELPSEAQDLGSTAAVPQRRPGASTSGAKEPAPKAPVGPSVPAKPKAPKAPEAPKAPVEPARPKPPSPAPAPKPAEPKPAAPKPPAPKPPAPKSAASSPANIEFSKPKPVPASKPAPVVKRSSAAPKPVVSKTPKVSKPARVVKAKSGSAAQSKRKPDSAGAIPSPSDSGVKQADSATAKVEAVAIADTSQGAASGTAATLEGGSTTGQEQAARVEDKAPLLLKKAAVIVVIGSLVPYVGHNGSWITNIASKLLVLIGCGLFYACVLARTDAKLNPALKKLGSMRFLKESEKRSKSAVETIVGFIPTPLHILAWILLISGFFVISLEPGLATKEVEFMRALSEVGMMAWAAATVAHIEAYQRGGKFNPLFPMMFLAMAFSGTASLLGNVGGLMSDDAPLSPALLGLGALGSLAVAIGGFFACYTIFLAMKQAKIEGDSKREAQRMARKAERSARKTSTKKK